MGESEITYITPSFYSSVMYWKKKEDADMQELLDLVDHKPVETTPVMQAGIEFEDEVRHVCEDGLYSSKDEVANNIAEIVRGSIWQVPIRTEVTVDGKPLVIIGRMDCLKRNHIYDIKRVLRYELGKYSGSIQHLAYMKAENIPNFKYLIKCGDSFYTESYNWDENSDKLLQERCTELLHWLDAVGLYKRYQNHWTLNVK